MPVCANCGHDNREGAKFCEECGLSFTARPPTAQRKTVTVLFCDLTGSTALGATLDPERLRVVLTAYYERMKGIVERYGGSVEKFIGDAVVAVFGVTVSGAFVPALAAWSLVLVVLIALALYETVELKRTATAAI